jgi:hypothetical protein
MSVAGPTRGAIEHCERWEGRHGAALALRVSMLVFPVALSLAITAVAGRIFARPGDLGPAIVWWLTISAIATLTLTLTNRLMRRFLPIVAMLRLSLVFPDQAPSRFKMALRTGTVRQLEKKAATGALGADVRTSAETLLVLAATLGDHDRLTRGHSERVRAYTNMIAQEMKLGAEEQDLLHWSALLHDIGKLEVPAEILNKSGRPDEAEWKILQGHPAAATHYLEPLADWLGEWRNAATEHHERWDGGGYPLGLRGEEITLAGRIVAVADAYDTITSVRSYKKAMSAADARAEIARCAGTQFDPAVVRAFLAVSVGDLRRVMGPVSWLAQLPILATAPTATVPAISNAVVSSMAAGTVAVATWRALCLPPCTSPSTPSVDRPPSAARGHTRRARLGPQRRRSGKPRSRRREPASPDRTRAIRRGSTGTEQGPRTCPVRTVAGPDAGLHDRLPHTPAGAHGGRRGPERRRAPAAGPHTPTGGDTPPHAHTDTDTDTYGDPSPAPTPAAPPPPVGPGQQRHYFDNHGPGDTGPHAVLGFTEAMPTTQVLHDYDVGRDDHPGLLLKRGASGFGESDLTRIQTWAFPRSSPSPISGPASIRIHVAPAGADWSKSVSIRAVLQRCSDNLSNCREMGTTPEVTVPTAHDGGFAAVDLAFGDISSGGATPHQRRTVVRIIVGSGSQADVVLAYATAAYAGYVDLPD